MSQSNRENLENARTGYQAAVNLWTVEGQTFWAKFNAMLVANSILLASIGFSASRQNVPPRFITMLLPIIGIVLSIVWLCMTARSYAFDKYWIYSARELEQRLHPVKTALRGRTFSKGDEVRFHDIGTEKIKLQIPLLGKPRVRTASYILIAAFLLIYVVALVVPIWDTKAQPENSEKATMLISKSDTRYAVESCWVNIIVWLIIALIVVTVVVTYWLVQLGYFFLWRAKRPFKDEEMSAEARKLATILSTILVVGFSAFSLLLLYLLLK